MGDSRVTLLAVSAELRKVGRKKKKRRRKKRSSAERVCHARGPYLLFFDPFSSLLHLLGLTIRLI
jgi:hypothetical protein